MRLLAASHAPAPTSREPHRNCPPIWRAGWPAWIEAHRIQLLLSHGKAKLAIRGEQRPAQRRGGLASLLLPCGLRIGPPAVAIGSLAAAIRPFHPCCCRRLQIELTLRYLVGVEEQQLQRIEQRDVLAPRDLPQRAGGAVAAATSASVSTAAAAARMLSQLEHKNCECSVAQVPSSDLP